MPLTRSEYAESPKTSLIAFVSVGSLSGVELPCAFTYFTSPGETFASLSASFIERARQRTLKDAHIEYHVLDAAQVAGLRSAGAGRFDKAVCTMALMDMPEITPMFSALSQVLKPGGAFVFSITHPCFHTAAIRRFTEIYEEESGHSIVHSGVKVSSYLFPFARKTEGIMGQPEPQWFYHRPICVLFQAGFSAGFVVDGIEEPGFPDPGKAHAGIRWNDMPEIPPIMVVRMRLT